MGDERDARNVFARLWAGIKKVFTLGLAEVKVPAEVPSNVEELRRLIISYEQRGLELKDARLWLQRAEGEPDKASLYVTYGFYEANRQGQKKVNERRAIGFLASAIVLFVIYISLWYVFQLKFQYIKFTMIAAIVAFILFLINIIRLLCLIPRADLEVTGIPKTTDELCPVIVEYARRGVNVERAWELYGEAEKVATEVKTEDTIIQKRSRSLLQRAYSDLLIKSKLRWPSILAVIFSVLVLMATVFSFCAILIWEEVLPIEEVIIGIPVFVIIWGLVGSASFSLVQANPSIRERLMNWYDLIRYFCRIIAGGILAAVVFYIIQLGAVSLPGNVSKEITAALERAEAVEKYTEAVRWTSHYEERDMEKDINVWAGLESFEGLGLEDKYKVLEFYANEWSSLKPRAGIEEPDGRAVTIEVSPLTLEKAIGYYKTIKASRDDEFRGKLEKVYLPRIEKRMMNREPEFAAIKETIEQKDDMYDKLSVLLLSADKWSPVYNREGGVMLDTDMVKKAINSYNTPSSELRRAQINLENQLEAAKSDLKSAIRGRQTKYKDELKKVRRWKCYFPSEGIKKQKKEIEAEKVKLYDTKRALLEEKERIEAEPPSPERDTRLEEITKNLTVNETLISETESKISEKETELDDAYLAENAPPIWESPLFIVLAFLSGYSVEFASRLIDKIAKSYNNGNEKKTSTPPAENGSGVTSDGATNTPA